jgi:hypothetical protein
MAFGPNGTRVREGKSAVTREWRGDQKMDGAIRKKLLRVFNSFK